MRQAFLLSLLLVPSVASADDARFAATDGKTYGLEDIVKNQNAAVLIFFSPRCACLTAHEPRMLALESKLRASGVRIWMVDSNRDQSDAEDRKEALRRSYPFPILLDPEGVLAERFGATFATYTVVLNRMGQAMR